MAYGPNDPRTLALYADARLRRVPIASLDLTPPSGFGNVPFLARRGLHFGYAFNPSRSLGN